MNLIADAVEINSEANEMVRDFKEAVVVTIHEDVVIGEVETDETLMVNMGEDTAQKDKESVHRRRECVEIGKFMLILHCYLINLYI